MYKDLKDTEMFLIMEDTYTGVTKNVTEKKLGDLTYLDFQTVLQSFEVQNRNKRIYRTSFMTPSLHDPHIVEMQQANGWPGEAGHPMSDDPKRIMTIDPKYISHKINKHWVEGNFVYGQVSTLVNRYGRDMTMLMMQGIDPAFSLRAMCPMKPDAASRGKVQSGKAFIVTYDWVFHPSHKEAYRDRRCPVTMQDAFNNNKNVMESTMIPVTESFILDYIRDYSKNIKVVSSMWEIATENMEITEDRKFAILKEGNDRLYVSIDDQIRNEVRSYMKNMF